MPRSSYLNLLLMDMNDDFGPESGYTASFPFDLAEDYYLKPLRFGIEYGNLYEVKLNAKVLKRDPDPYYFDHSASSAKAWARSKLSNELSVGRSLVTKWLSGTHNFTIDTLVDICLVLDISMIELLHQPQKKEASYQH